LSVPVQVIAWKDSSPKWPVMCQAGRKTSLPHSLCCLFRLRSLMALWVVYIQDIMSALRQNQLLLHLMLTTLSLLCIYNRTISNHITVSHTCSF